MTKKIFRYIFIVAAAILLASLIVIMGVLYEYFSSIQKNLLTAQTSLAAQGVEHEGLTYFDDFIASGYRLTWVAADGTVLYDSAVNAATMENHAGRAEIQEALTQGSSDSERTSSTLAVKTLYHAQRLADGTVLRAAVTQQTAAALVLGMLYPLLVILAAALLLSALLAHRLARRLIEPLNSLNLDQPLENDTYEELSPLLTRIEHQHRQIDRQLEQLQQRQDEFAAITDNMNEGLILLNQQGLILSINPAAARLFNTDLSCVGHSMLTVERSLPMQDLIRAAQSGKHAEAVITLGGEYQIDASPVITEGRISGIALLAFDITEKLQAEKQRREFSANVSHELKTPLQSIMGSAELLENGLVQAEDVARFVGHIRTEATRLVTLIDDILRLSQLDEGVALTRETIDLSALAREAVAALSGEAETQQVSLTVNGGPAMLEGVRPLLYEIIYNLCDNAIKYNVPHGQVAVSVTPAAGSVILTVRDSGIGIPPEHQPRIFERFYRVDKSHSKATGGTGLGLSIVKHAALYHHASLQLSSEPGQGTVVTVRFPV